MRAQRYTRRGSVEGTPKGVAGGQARQGRRASRGPRRSRSSRSLSLAVVSSSSSLILFASPCFLRPCFYPLVLSLFLALTVAFPRASVSFCP